MKILHYSLGFPPYRTGGLTKFCVDLMIQQSRNGDEVALLWPGKMKFAGSLSKVSIKHRGTVTLANTCIQNFEIINPLPISYDEGIVDIESFMLNTGVSAYRSLLEYYKPDVIHIHTLMGLHKVFLDEAKRIGIRIVFSAHDFFPICPKITLYRNKGICTSMDDCIDCPKCNTTALSMNKIKILQSPLYRKMKNNFVVKKFRKSHRDTYLNDNNVENEPRRSMDDYKLLRHYYGSMLLTMDMIHFNSTITKKVYNRVFSNFPVDKVLNITHSDIYDNRTRKTFTDDLLRIRYLGPQGGGKGFFC